MTYGAATYGGTTVGGSAIVDDDVTSRAPERTLTRVITIDERTLTRSITADTRELLL